MEAGYVVLRGVLDRASLAAMRDAFERCDRTRAGAGRARESGTRHVPLSFEEPAFDRIYSDPLVLGAASEVLGGPFRVLQAGGRDPLPGYGLQGLHTDWLPRASGEPPSVVTALWLLDDFTAESGATHVIPGSHRDPTPLPRSMRAPGHVHPGERAVAARAGDVLVFNGHLWHRGTRNRSDGPRRVLQCQFVVAEHQRPDADRPPLPARFSAAARALLEARGA